MSAAALPGPEPAGRLTDNIMHFARVLRAAGLPVGPGKVIDAIRAVEVAGLARRDDFYWTLFAVFVNRQDQRELFDQAFHIFWRKPQFLEQMMAMLLPSLRLDMGEEAEERQLSRRLAEALRRLPGLGEPPPESEDANDLRIDAAFTYSEREVLQKMDFEAMSAAEMAEAKLAMARLRLPVLQVLTRRLCPHPRGARVDMRASLRAALRSGDAIALKRRQPRRRHPPLVVLCDISGSMSRYGRMFLHFLHAITNDRDRVHVFTFGTRLTNITRHLRQRDVDVALARVAQAVEDFSGGTRIGATLAQFNRDWSRRVLGQGAVVLLISDGLDRDAGAGLEREMERLHKSCRRLIWLNPLLRYEGFEPKSRGVRAMLPHVDEFRAAHNLASLLELATILSRPGAARPERRAWQEESA